MGPTTKHRPGHAQIRCFSFWVGANCSTKIGPEQRKPWGRSEGYRGEMDPYPGLFKGYHMGGRPLGLRTGSLTSDSPAGVSGSGWRCSAPFASAAPAAADALHPGSADAHLRPAPAGTAPAAGQVAVLSQHQGSLHRFLIPALPCPAFLFDLGPGLPLARPRGVRTHKEAGLGEP